MKTLPRVWLLFCFRALKNYRDWYGKTNPTPASWRDGNSARFLRQTTFSQSKFVLKISSFSLAFALSFTPATTEFVQASPPPAFTAQTLNSAPNLTLVQTLTVESGWINSVAISPDGQTLVAGCTDSTIKVWNLKTGQFIGSFVGHLSGISSIAISPDGEILVSGSSDRTIKVWNLRTNQLIYNFTEDALIFSVAISSDSRTLVSVSGGGNFDKSIIKWRNLNTGEVTRTLTDYATAALSLAISPNRQLLVSGDFDQSIKVWNFNTSQLIRIMTGHTDAVSFVTISPNGLTLASSSWDNSIKLWNLNSGQLIRTLRGHRSEVNTLAISPDGMTLFSGSSDNTLKVWNLNTGELILTLTDHRDDITSLATSLDGQILVSGSADGTLKIWQVMPR